MAHIIGKGHETRSKLILSGKKSHSNIPKEKVHQLWRVIAPFVTVPKKVVEKEAEQFSFYLKKKPAVLLRDLSSFMSDSVDLPSLFHETADVLQRVIKAKWVTLYLVDNINNEVYVSTAKPTAERHKIKWKIKTESIVAAFVAKKREYVIVEDLLLDRRFPEGIGYNASEIPKSVMCIPIVTPDGTCFGVIEFVRSVHNEPFVQDDLRICVMVTAWMGVAIHQNQERLALKRQQELNDYLLDLVRCYFADNVLIDKLMSEVVKFAKVTLGAERGSFFILDQDNDEMIAHLFDEECEHNNFKTRKVRFSKESGIAGLVARTGITLNIKDAYKDSRFYKDIDQKTGFITRSILCMPILGASGVLGVVQVVNKKNGGCFTSADENLFKTFSLYCSLAVHYTKVNGNINKQNHLNNIVLKALALQQKPCIHDMEYFKEQPFIKIPENFDDFEWYIKNTEELMFAPQYVLHIVFELIESNEINVEILMTFILTVRKFYRDIPYHNFEHAFNVCHCMYLLLKKNRAKFTKLEIKALIIACICHDLDHVGLTNSCLQMIKHDLAALYESSILEQHHIQVTFMILKDYEIFRGFTTNTRKLFHTEIEKAILSTDLALYFGCRQNLVKIYNAKTFTWSNEEHRAAVKSIMMNTCDLSGMCKPFLTAKRMCNNLYREYYRQGDLEKELGGCPLSIMDRDKQDSVPGDQIRFLDVVVIPCLDLLRAFLPNVKDLYLGAICLRDTWQDIIDMKGKKIWRQDDSIVKL